MRLSLSSSLLAFIPQILAVYNTTIHAPGPVVFGRTLCLDLVNDVRQNGTRVRVFPANNAPAQVWDIPVFGELLPIQKPGIFFSASKTLSVNAGIAQSSVILNNPNPQGWLYDPTTKWVFIGSCVCSPEHGQAECLTRSAVGEEVFSATCDMASVDQQWDLN